MLRFIKKVFAIVLALSVSAAAAFSDEGMWMPHQMKDLNLASQGLQMDPNDLYKTDGTGLMSAVVYLGGGTGEFVSASGLILTNHHVAFGAIQRASDKEHDYLSDGFLAKTMAEEISSPSYIADVLLGYDDVTAAMQRVIKPNQTAIQRYYALEKAEKEMVAAEEKKGKDIYATVESMYNGNKYYLFRFKRLRDIRLVYAPPQTIGNFGGEVDNWMWPRHTGDFSFMRAYVSPDGVGAAYDAKNVPYKPKSILKISLEGLDKGDFTFAMGYPGGTYRNYTLSEFQKEYNFMKKQAAQSRDTIDFFTKAGEKDREIEIKYASLVKGLANRMKNYEGKLEGFKKYEITAKKELKEKDFLAWAASDPQRQKKYGDIVAKIEQYMKKEEMFNNKTEALGMLARGFSGPALLSMGYGVYRWVNEAIKPDMQREPGFQERDFPFVEVRMKMAERGYHYETDIRFFKYLLGKIAEKDPAIWPAALKTVLAKGPEAAGKFVDELYAGTILRDPQKRLELLRMKPEALMKQNDLIIKLAAELEKESKVLREQNKALYQERSDLKKVYMAAVLEMSGGNIAPDANGSIRFTYGPVASYEPKDAVEYLPFTTLKGVMEKEQPEFPFAVPAGLKELYKNKDFGRYMDSRHKDVVTCFLHVANITGGNSGSPVLNAKGEQVGILFDMTYESVLGDYYIIPELQRAVSVDIRYVLFVTEKMAGATHLIREMGL